jgi:hypothetical protein
MAGKRIRLRWLGLVLAAAIFVGCVLLYLYYPLRPRSALGWVALFVIGIPSWALIEWMGSAVLGAHLFKRLSSFGRIALGVPVLIALSLVAGAVIWLGGRVIAHF